MLPARLDPIVPFIMGGMTTLSAVDLINIGELNFQRFLRIKVPEALKVSRASLTDFGRREK